MGILLEQSANSECNEVPFAALTDNEVDKIVLKSLHCCIKWLYSLDKLIIWLRY